MSPKTKLKTTAVVYALVLGFHFPSTGPGNPPGMENPKHYKIPDRGGANPAFLTMP